MIQRLISIGLWSIFIVLLVESAMDVAHQRLQIETQSRDYRSGPIDGVFMASTHELIYLTVEDQEKPGGDDGIWQWAMMTDEDSGSIGCTLSKVYHRGESATMICPKTEGIYYAFAKRAAISSLSADDHDGLEEYFHRNESYCATDGHCLDAFILNPDADDMDSAARFSKAKDGSVASDPVKIVASQYCFLWAYTIDEEDRVGYVSTQAEQTETEGSYIRYRLRMWITEANAMNESEINHQFPQTEYAGVLTRRFKTKGLEPCIRYSHQSIEIETAVPTYVYDPSGVGVFWTMFLKAHTNTVLAALSDLSFTIASRQHIGLYGCYVAESRVLLDTRQFSFLKAQRNEMSQINLGNSYLSPVLRQYMTTKLKHVFGHYIQYIGRPWEYESAAHRRDVQVFQNPCMTLEFVFTARGVAYMTQNWLTLGNTDITQVALPSLTDGIFLQTSSNASNQTPSSSSNQTASSSSNQTASSSSNQTTGSSRPYIKVYDFVFTSMHLVLLTADSHIFLHPTSITYEGFGLIRETQSYRPGALVSRRWCASTGTPKEHNMIVPAFSASGNLIFIQIVPGDDTTTMWVHTPSQTCAQPRRSGEGNNNKKGNQKDEKERSKEEMADFLEYCIHHREIPRVRSKLDDENVEKEEERQDKCKEIVQIAENAEDSPEEIKKGKDTLLAYWIAGQTLLDEKDPHFYGEEEESSPGTSSQVSTNYNTHTLYEADRRGTKIARILASNGLDLRLTHMTVGQKKQLWLHDVQFTAIERQFLLAVEFKSSEIKKTDFVAAMMSLVVKDQPVQVSRSEETIILDTDVIFSGVLIVRPTDQSNNDSSRLRGSVKTFALNSALNTFVIHLDHWSGGKSEDVLIHASFDGSHARPIGYLSAVNKKNSTFKLRFADKHPTIGGDEGVLKPDVVVSPHGLVSVLLRKANMTDKSETNEERDDYPQAVILGSCAVPEPLRKIKPFKGSSYIFQRITTDGQVIFGDYRLRAWMGAGNTSSEQPEKTGGFYPKLIDLDATKFLATPFESVLRGVDDNPESDDDDDAPANEFGSICPFSDFKLHFQRFDFAEVEYQTRITVELIYLGRTIPLEADVLVEFDDHHGISVTIHSAIEENRDQTLVRKTIDVHTFLTPADLEKMYGFWETHEDGQPIQEEIAIFSITVRPTIVNSHCRSEDLFKTISINVGCNPFTSMRFIPEAVGLKKISFLRSNDYTDRENQWTVWKDGDEYEVTIPRRKINYAQRNLFKCQTETSEKRGYCSVPRHFTQLFKENIYSIHFTKSIVPKFEQRLTRHIRRVTANIFLYNLLGGEMKTNTSLLDSRCHNLGPTCTDNDASCVTGLNETEANKVHNRPWTTHFFEQVDQLHQHTDIYRHYRDCFSLWRITADKEKVKVPRGLPLRMSSEPFWIFNSTNYNAFSFNKHRNIIFLIRAVVLNTPDNGFTYCQKLETFFLLQMTGVAPARQPLPWHFYLGLITFVLFVFVLVYFYFARSSRWQSEVSSRRIREEEEKEQREADAKLLEDNDLNSDAFAKWATNLRNVVSESGKKQTLGPSTQPPKGLAEEKVDNSGDKLNKS